MKLSIEAYDCDDNKIADHCFTWKGLRYKATSWYRQLPWRYTIARVAYFLIVKDKKVIEKVVHHLP